MKAFLTRKLFGKIPVWVVMVLAFGIGYYLFTRKRKGITGSAEENPAASATDDPTSPFPYSAPNMFPTQGPAGPSGPVGPAGPAGPPSTTTTTVGGGSTSWATGFGGLPFSSYKTPQVAPGIQPVDTKLSTGLQFIKNFAPAPNTGTPVGNTPSYNTSFGGQPFSSYPKK